MNLLQKNKELEILHKLNKIEKQLTTPVVVGQSEQLDLLTEIANSDTLYSNTRHRMIAKKLLKSHCG